MEAAGERGTKALAASRKADELRVAGSGAEADAFDRLAKVALQQQLQAGREAKDAEPTIATQQAVVGKLKFGLDQMTAKLAELHSKRNQLVARAKTAQAQSQMLDAAENINVLPARRAPLRRSESPAGSEPAHTAPEAGALNPDAPGHGVAAG